MAGPLKGLKILDFTTLLPGPYATMTLADLGADVLRVISGSRPDLAAFMPPFLPGTDLSCAIAYLGRGKRCLALNLKDPRAGVIVRRLVAVYDIVIEQFRPGVMAKFGLDYETLRETNPTLIYCSLTGYGQTGPLKDRAGEGQHVDVSMTDGVIAFNAIAGAAFLVDGTENRREEGFLNGGSLYDFYETKDGGYLSFGGLEPPFFAAFRGTIGPPDLIAGGVAPPDLPRVKEEVRAILKAKTREEWMALFGKVDACVEPVLSLGEALGERQH